MSTLRDGLDALEAAGVTVCGLDYWPTGDAGPHYCARVADVAPIGIPEDALVSVDHTGTATVRFGWTVGGHRVQITHYVYRSVDGRERTGVLWLLACVDEEVARATRAALMGASLVMMARRARGAE